MVDGARSLAEAALQGVEGGGQDAGISVMEKGVSLDASQVEFLFF